LLLTLVLLAAGAAVGTGVLLQAIDELLFRALLPSRPFKPYCAAIKTCLPWEVDKYQREMENYVEELKRYVQQAHKAAHAYAEDAVKYAKCELNEE
jgi:hypothetical protein